MIDLYNLICSAGCLITSPGSSALTPSQLILSGGEGYINFRIGELRGSKNVDFFHLFALKRWNSSHVFRRWHKRWLVWLVPGCTSALRTESHDHLAEPVLPCSQLCPLNPLWGDIGVFEKPKEKFTSDICVSLSWPDTAVKWKTPFCKSIDFYVVSVVELEKKPSWFSMFVFRYIFRFLPKWLRVLIIFLGLCTIFPQP